MQFIEGGLEKDASSDDEGTGDGTHISEEDASSDDEDSEDATHISVLNEANIKGVDSLHLLDQVHFSLAIDVIKK